MRLRIALDAKMEDVRLRDRLLTEGKITKAQVEEYLAKLPDDASNFERVGEETAETTTAEAPLEQ